MNKDELLKLCDDTEASHTAIKMSWTDVQAIARALKSLLTEGQSTTWQDISTAPEGELVWVWWGERARLAEFLRMADGPFGPFANWVPRDRGSISVGCKPTHWQPYSIPAPPQEPRR